MASTKTESVSRPVSVQRPPSSTGPMNVPARAGAPRNHSHSFSLGALNGSHRVARRKSMSINKDLSGAVAAVQGLDDAALEALVGSTPDGNIAGIHRAGSTSTIRPDASAHATMAYQGPPGPGSTAAADEKPMKSKSGLKSSKARRASEGAYLSKSERKRTSGDIRCETCGKGYKHSSCLTKHLWEHTPQWQVTSKFLISKHQQVQMLEAASVLLTMTTTSPEVALQRPAEDSDSSAPSPMPSGSSAIHDDDTSSVETTPPPTIEEEDDEMEYSVPGNHGKEHYRYSSTSSVFSQSYQSIPSMAGSIPTGTSYSSAHPQGFTHRRPSTSGTAYSMIPSEDENKLSAAVEGVSFGTPKTLPTETDIPPVPPLPAQYASHKATLSSGALSGYSDLGIPAGPTPRISDERGGYQAPHHSDDEQLSRRSASRGHADDQQGMFAMEE